jgi:hypothetical protein
MVWILLIGLQILSLVLLCVPASAQTRAQLETPEAATSAEEPVVLNATRGVPGPMPLEWVPPAMAALSAEAQVKSSFTLDRAMLGVAAGLLPDSEAETRHAIGKLDGVSVHLLRFGADGIMDEESVDAIRRAYHARGWKHMVTSGSSKSKGPVHSGTTDVWAVLDGTNLRGAVVLVETVSTLTLVTIAGDLSPIDLLHLRGHFGIPRDITPFQGNGLKTPDVE